MSMHPANTRTFGSANDSGDHLVSDRMPRRSKGAFLPRSKNSATNRSFAMRIMRELKARFEHKPSYELAEILQCDVRSAQRYFAGERVPEGPIAFYMIRNPEIGVALVEEATKTLSPEEHRRFWEEMTRAALRASLRGTDRPG